MGVTWKYNNGSFCAYRGNKLAGMVSRNPIHPNVMNPGLWSASIHTIDGGLVSVILCKTAMRARIALTHALNRRWTYAIWQRWGIRNAPRTRRRGTWQ